MDPHTLVHPMRASCFVVAAFVPGLLAAQTLAPSVVASAGGSGSAGGTTLNWTLGEMSVAPLANGSNMLTQGFHQADPLRVRLNVSALLQGPYNSGTGLMGDALRILPGFPLVEPYTALGYVHTGTGGGEVVAPTSLSITGNNAIVDWVVLELRSATNAATVLGSRSALLQRDGDVVDTDGTSAVAFVLPPASYHVAVLHRNHLGVMSLAPLPLLAGVNDLDFRAAATPTYGTNARKSITGTVPAEVLWAGDVTFNDVVKYTGSGNDRDPILARIGGNLPTNSVSGYWSEDCTLDGTVKYTGAGNDRDVILLNIGGSVPTNSRNGTLP
jgi:hypothetical protein